MLELIVVVLILGMIAAIASSWVFDTANSARNNSGRQSLAVIRNAIELYRQQNGTYPGQSSGDDRFKRDMATMLRTQFPVCPVGNTNSDVHVAGSDAPLSASGDKGWRYSRKTGEFIINHAKFSSW